MPQVESLAALNLWLEERCKALWQDIPHGIELGSVADAWRDEVASLMPMGRPFDGFVEYGKRVSPTCLVHLDRNRYSVPVRIPRSSRAVFRFDRAQHSDVISRSIPI